MGFSSSAVRAAAGRYISIYIRQHDNEDEYYADKQLGMTIDSSSSWFVMLRPTFQTFISNLPRRLVVYQNGEKTGWRL
jgi:hypothetical protein